MSKDQGSHSSSVSKYLCDLGHVVSLVWTLDMSCEMWKIGVDQDFLTLSLLIFLRKSLFVWGHFSVHCRVFSNILGFHLLDAHNILPYCDKQKCLPTLKNVPRRGTTITSSRELPDYCLLTFYESWISKTIWQKLWTFFSGQCTHILKLFSMTFQVFYCPQVKKLLDYVISEVHFIS